MCLFSWNLLKLSARGGVMFSRKKRFWEKKGFYAGIATAALAAYSLSLLISVPEEEIVDVQESNGVTQSVVKNEKVREYDKKQNKSTRESNEDYYEVYDRNDDNSQYLSKYDEEFDSGEAQESKNHRTYREEYYLVVEENGLIKIYQCDLDGGKNLVRTTDISYSLLYDDDQQMFSDGIMVDTEDELMEILQDFES